MSGLVVSTERILADLRESPVPDIEAWPSTERACLTPGAAAGVLGISPESVARRAAAGLIEAFRTEAGHRRYYADSVYAYRACLRRATGGSSPAAGAAHAAPPQPVGRR